MKRLPAKIAMPALLLFAVAAFPPHAAADPPLKLKGGGTLTVDDDGLGVLRLQGTATQLGQFDCYAELAFEPGAEEGSLDGFGVVAFTAANGDVLVGRMTWHTGADGTGLTEFRWQDAVTFSDGTTAESTGRFANRRP